MCDQQLHAEPLIPNIEVRREVPSIALDLSSSPITTPRTVKYLVLSSDWQQ